MKKLIFLILFLIIPSMVLGGNYSFSKFTWSKFTLISSGTVCITSLISGFYYEKLSDDAYANYQNAENEVSAVSYRITSEDHNTSSAFWKNAAIYSGAAAVVSFGLDYFIFGREETKISFLIEPVEPTIKVSMKF